MSSHDARRATAGIPLQTLVAEPRSRCEAVSRLQGGATYFHEEFEIFRQVAEEQRILLQSPPDELSRIPDEEGNEHQVWYLPKSKSVLKATWPGTFGLSLKPDAATCWMPQGLFAMNRQSTATCSPDDKTKTPRQCGASGRRCYLQRGRAN